MNATQKSDQTAATGPGRPGTEATALRQSGSVNLLGLPGTDDRLLTVLAAAAPFPERVSGEHFVTLRDRGRRLIAQRSARWLQSAVGEDEIATRALFQHRQRSGRDLGAGLVDVAVRDPGKLPDWATALIEFLLAQPVTAAEDPATGMVGAPFMSFSRAAERLLDWQDGLMGWQAQSADGNPQTTLRGVPVTSEAHQDVIAQFVGRVSQACAASFSFETRIFAPGCRRARLAVQHPARRDQRRLAGPAGEPAGPGLRDRHHQPAMAAIGPRAIRPPRRRPAAAAPDAVGLGRPGIAGRILRRFRRPP